MADVKVVPASEYSPVYKTKYHELGYQKQGNGNWRWIDLHGGKEMGLKPGECRAIGQSYPTRESLLGDLEDYASLYGCEGARTFNGSLEGYKHCPDCGKQALRLIETTEPDRSGEFKECRTCDLCANMVYIVRRKD